MGDMSSPLKTLVPDFKKIEDKVLSVILERFGLESELPESVKHADLVLLATEKRDLIERNEVEWAVLEGIEPMDRRIGALPPIHAKQMFMNAYYGITSEEPA